MNIPTTEDWERFKDELLLEVKKIFNQPVPVIKFLKSSEVKKMFHISETKLYELRRDFKIPFLKVDGKYLYDYNELLNAFKNAGNE
jgi:hypothetical protein